MDEAAIQVVVVEDHLAVRKGLELLLQREGFRVIGVAESAAQAAPMILERRPDLAVIDIGLERGSGLDVAMEVLAEWPGAAVLLYTGGAFDGDAVRGALASGVCGIALKAGPSGELLAAARAVASGQRYVDPRLGGVLPPDADEPDSGPRLSTREGEILDLLASGLKTDEIAARLVIAPTTVETHVRNLKRKLGARTRVHALALRYAQREQ
jgi:DNA-binding NarL/FixJ family response regulator